MENNQENQDQIIDENLENSFYEIPREVVECDIEFLVTKNFCGYLQQSNTKVNPRIDGHSTKFGEMLYYALSLEPYRINRPDESDDEDVDGMNTPPVSPPETPPRLIKVDVDRMNESLADSQEYHIVNDMETSSDEEEDEEQIDINNNTNRVTPQPRRVVVNRLRFHVNRMKRTERRRFRRSTKYVSRVQQATMDLKAIEAIKENLDRKREIVALRSYSSKLMELNQMPEVDFEKMWNFNFMIR